MGRVIELKWTCSDCGAKDILGRHKAKAAERDYLTWAVGDDVTLEINNLGGLHDVRRGVLPAER